MKKFLGILAIAAVFASCDNAASDSTTADSLRRDSLMKDSIQKAQMNTPVTPIDSLNKMNGSDTGVNKMNGGDTTQPK